MNQAQTVGEVRIDVWLWAARFFKTRSLAKQAIERGRISLGGQTVNKPARCVRVADQLGIERGEERWVVEVLGLSTARGPATVAQALYREDEAAKLAREQARQQRQDERAGFSAPPKRPDKQARRRIQSLQKPDKLPPWFPR